MAVAAIASFASVNNKHHHHHHHGSLILPPKHHHPRIQRLRIRCNGTTNHDQESQPQNNALLKLAWYGSELLGIAASAFRPPSNEEAPQRLLESIDRAAVVDTIKQDFQRSYFVTGDLTLNAYEEDCEFADPAGSFKGLQRFKRNCTNFGSLLEKSNMKLMKWEDFEELATGDSAVSCHFLGGQFFRQLDTQYYFDPQSGKVCRHAEHWNVPKMALFKQILRPSRGFGLGDYLSRWLKALQVKL